MIGELSVDQASYSILRILFLYLGFFLSLQIVLREIILSCHHRDQRLNICYVVIYKESEVGVVAERSRVVDASSIIYRMWVRILAWSVGILVSMSKVLNHKCFFPLIRTN